MKFSNLSLASFRVLLVLICTLSLTGLQAAIGPAAKTQAPASPQGRVEVVDFRGIPLADVAVKLQAAPAAPLPHLVEETTVTVTGKDGAFLPPAGAPKDSILLLEKKNYAVMAYYPDRVPARVILPPAARLLGTVIDDRGVSVPNALIGPVAPPAICEHGPSDVTHPTCNPLRFVTTNDRGFFRVDGLPIHKYEFLIRAPDRQPRVVQAVTGAPFTVMVNTGGTTVTGQVVGTRDRQPQPGVYVQALTGSGAIQLYEITDSDGRFAFGNLPNQEWVFNVYTGPKTAHHSAQAILVPAAPEQTSLTLLLNQGSAIGGRVVDESTSAPMTGITLSLLGAGNSAPQSLNTGPDGSFVFTEVDALEHFTLRFDPIQYVRVLPDGSTRDYLDISAGSGEDRNGLFIALRKKTPVQGYVVDVSGAPIPDADIRFTALDVAAKTAGKAGVETALLPEIQTISNGTGHFKAGLYPPGNYQVQARKDNLVSDIKTLEAFTTSTVAPIELRMTPAKPLAGRLLDTNDQPVTGALVSVMRDGITPKEELQEHEIGLYKTTRTDERGEFSIEGLVPNHAVTLRASHTDFVQAATGSFTPGTANTATTDQVVLRFPPGGEINVRTIDSTGKPIAGAEVIVHYSQGMEGMQKARRTNASGTAVVRSLPVQRLERLDVRHQAYADVEITQPISLPQPDYPVTLQRKGAITVLVQGTTSGVEASQADQAVTLLYSPTSASPSAGSQSPPAESSFTEAGSSKPTEGKALFPNLNPGWYKAAILAGSTFAESEVLQLKGDVGNVEITLDAKPGPALRGKVTDKATGRGIAGASVSVKPAAQFSGAESLTPRLAVTSASGEFNMPDAPAGAVKVRVVAVGYPEHEEIVAASSRTTPLNVVLSNEPGGLVGTVTMNNRPVPGVLLVLSSPSAAETPVASALADESGNYSLTNFPVGQYILSLEAPVGDGDEVTRRSETVNVTSGNMRHDVVLPDLVTASGTARLGGQVPKYSDGNMPTLMFLPLSAGADSKHATLDENGNFTVQIVPGTYSVGLEDRQGVEVTIPANGAQNLQLNY